MLATDNLQRKSARRIPRVLLHAGSANTSSTVQLTWPQLQATPVFDLSYGGLVCSPEGWLHRPKLEQIFDLKLKLRGLEDLLPLKAKLIQIHSTSFGFAFESLSTDNRLILEQSVKDSLVIESLHPVSTQGSDSEVWLHGMFDTNFIFRSAGSEAQIEIARIEYDNLLWSFDRGQISLRKTTATLNTNSTESLAPSYRNLLERGGTDSSVPPLAQVKAEGKVGNSLSGRVSMGASWMHRLLKCLEKAEGLSAIQSSAIDLKPLIQLLKQQTQSESSADIPAARPRAFSGTLKEVRNH